MGANVYFEHDLPGLQLQDNFATFAIDNPIMKLARCKIHFHPTIISKLRCCPVSFSPSQANTRSVDKASLIETVVTPDFDCPQNPPEEDAVAPLRSTTNTPNS